MTASQQESSKQAAYFALYALLEFIIQVPLNNEGKDDKNAKKKEEENSQSQKLDSITFAQIINCLVSTGLIQKVIQLPVVIDINNKEEEGIIRLCLKLLISIIFKGQHSHAQFAMQNKFSSSPLPKNIQSVFQQQGISDESEMLELMKRFHIMIQKVHNFEIAQIHSESYVQYLQLLSQITLNCQVSDQPGFNSNLDFLAKNINQYSEICIQEDQRKKLLNTKDNGQKNLIYQFFFINYLLSISLVDVVKKNEEEASKDSTGKKKDEGGMFKDNQMDFGSF